MKHHTLTVDMIRKMKKQLENANPAPKYSTYILDRDVCREVVAPYSIELPVRTPGTLTPDPSVKTHSTCAHLEQPLARKKADKLIERCITALQGFDFDTFAFSGNSGALVAPILAHLLGKEMIMVRKPDERCVSRYHTEGFRLAQKYVLVDDLVCGGATAARIVRGVFDFAPQAELAAFLLYTNKGDILIRRKSPEFTSIMIQIEGRPMPF